MEMSWSASLPGRVAPVDGAASAHLLGGYRGAVISLSAVEKKEAVFLPRIESPYLSCSDRNLAAIPSPLHKYIYISFPPVDVLQFDKVRFVTRATFFCAYRKIHLHLL